MIFAVTSTSVMMPMVFCASLVPCEKLSAAADSNCSLRNQESICAGVDFRNSQYTSDHHEKAATSPISGATTMNASVSGHLPAISA